MYRYKILKIKSNGNVIIYVVLIGFLLMLISLIMLKMQLERSSQLQLKLMALNKSNDSINKNINYNREKVLSNIYDDAKADKKIDSNEKLIVFMRSYFDENSSKFDDGNFKATYDNRQDLIVIQYSVNGGTICKEYYSLSLEYDKLRFKFIGKEG